MATVIHSAVATFGITYRITGDSAVSSSGALAVTEDYLCIHILNLPFQLIRDVGITRGDDAKVGYYVGLMVSSVLPVQWLDLTILKHSLFFISQACTIFHLSQASDRIGRKPIILIGGAGMSIAMYCFGLSRTFWGLVLRYCTCWPMRLLIC